MQNTSEASIYLDKTNIDLLLLDINFPHQTGILFLRQLKKPPTLIFTTAYSEYAVESYELEVADYLLKPIGFERFEKTILKAKEKIDTINKTTQFNDNEIFSHRKLLIKGVQNKQFIFLTDLIYVKAMREYVQYHTVLGNWMELKPISLVEKELPEESFIRVHRSYIVKKLQ